MFVYSCPVGPGCVGTLTPPWVCWAQESYWSQLGLREWEAQTSSSLCPGQTDNILLLPSLAQSSGGQAVRLGFCTLRGDPLGWALSVRAGGADGGLVCVARPSPPRLVHIQSM